MGQGITIKCKDLVTKFSPNSSKNSKNSSKYKQIQEKNINRPLNKEHFDVNGKKCTARYLRLTVIVNNPEHDMSKMNQRPLQYPGYYKKGCTYIL